jgi:hypothetical protein
MATAMRVVGGKEGKGSKAMTMVTRMAGKLTATVPKRETATLTRVAGEQR